MLANIIHRYAEWIVALAQGCKLSWLTPIVFGVALVVLILDAGAGPGWGASSAHVVATRFDHVAASPLYDIIASAATTLIPAGEPGFRLGLLGALLGACTVAGVLAASQALLPKDPLAVSDSQRSRHRRAGSGRREGDARAICGGDDDRA
jgi:hypothetical protein